MTYLIINISVAIFALCAGLVILNHRIHKTMPSWLILISVIISASSMLVNQKFYSASFACFAVSASAIAVYVTFKLFKNPSFGGVYEQ